ncbi:MAG: glycosyltransferase [Candidatus Woesearchaeota archaeon]
MKVLFISEFFYPEIKGGGELSSFILAKNLLKNEKNNIEIHVLTSKKENLKEYEEIEKIKIHRLLETGEPNSIIGNINRLKFKKSLLKNLQELEKKENFDLIHCFNITSIYSILLKEKIKKPFVLHVNSPVLFCPKGTLIYQDKKECNLECNFLNYTKCYLKSKNIGKVKLNPILKYNPLTFVYLRKRYLEYKKLMKKFDYFFAISNFIKNKLIQENISKEKVFVIYNILDMIEEKNKKDYKINNENIKNKNNKKEEIKKILYLGSYTEPKGCKLLFDVLRKIDLNFEANFFGKGILKEYLLKNKNEKININDEVNYSLIPKIIKEHDIIIIPSLVSEGFSRAAYEGIFLKKLVIANNIGGIKDIIIDKKTGFLYNNEKELKELIEKAIKNELKINKKELEKHFKKLNNYESLIKIYEKITKN